jgi:hypothetical protein
MTFFIPRIISLHPSVEETEQTLRASLPDEYKARFDSLVHHYRYIISMEYQRLSSLTEYIYTETVNSPRMYGELPLNITPTMSNHEMPQNVGIGSQVHQEPFAQENQHQVHSHPPENYRPLVDL